MSAAKWWRTKGGVLVREGGRMEWLGRPGRKGGTKILSYKATGGFHGLIWLRNLTKAKAPARVRNERAVKQP